MILKFRFSNFRSFGGEQELSLISGRNSPDTVAMGEIPASSEKALAVCAVYGPNASGKTNVFRALAFMDSAVRESHRLWEPRQGVPLERFKSLAGAEQDSTFVLDFVASGARYQYGFSAKEASIEEEWLWAFPSGRRQVWFHRTSGNKITFGRHLLGENRTIAALMRTNSLYLSVAAQNNHEMLQPIYAWFEDSIDYVLPARRGLDLRTIQLGKQRDTLTQFISFLTVADLGIVDLKFETQEPPPELQAKVKQWMDATTEILGIPSGKIPNLTIPRETVTLLHRIGRETVPFDLSDESNGTLSYLSLLGPMVDTLTSGTTLIVDELDYSLHPKICQHLVKIFNETSTNPKCAQLIFNTHSTELLSGGLLHRDQIWFTEKDAWGSSALYPLSDFTGRVNEDFRKGYLQGRYGGIPYGSWESLEEALSNVE